MASEKIQFYYSTLSPPSWSIWLLLEELGLEYDGHSLVLSKGEHKTEEYKAVNHRQRCPGIKDGDFSMGESRAIAQYLCDKYAKGDLEKLYPKDLETRTKVNQVLWVDFDAYNVIADFVGAIPLLYKGITPDLSNSTEVEINLAFLEFFLESRKYLAADHMTICDICAFCSLCVLKVPEKDFFVNFPKIKAWMVTMKGELKSYEKCVGVNLTEFAKFYRGACAKK